MKRLIFLFLYVNSVFFCFCQSPERIFFSSFQPEGWDIYLCREGGKLVERFTDHPAMDYDARLSPDNKWVVFTSERDGFPRLYIRPLDKSEPARLLITSESMQDQAVISPDGREIAFVSTHNGDADIYKLPFLPDTLLSVDDATNLTNHPSGDFRPAFSPDGRYIVFSSDRAHAAKPHAFFSFAVDRIGDIFIMKNSGADVKRLTDSGFWDGSPVFSDDGGEIFFYSGRSGKLKLWKMNTDGTSQSQINFKGPNTISPTISGEKIICTSWDQDNGLFTLSSVDPISSEVAPVCEDQIDMLNPNANNDLIVFHGGPKPERQDNNRGGFAGNILVTGTGLLSLDGKVIQTYGVRRAFAAPPNPFKPVLIVEEHRQDNFTDDIHVSAYFAAFMLCLILCGMLAGIIIAIIHRKKVRPWRYLLYSIGAFSLFVLGAGGFVYFLIVEGMPLKQFSMAMTGLSVFFLVISLAGYRSWKKRVSRDEPHYRVSRLLTVTAGIAVCYAVYTAAGIYWFFDVRYDFYEVNYITNEVRHLFKIASDKNINPIHRQILDMKYDPDGSGFIISMGGFGASTDSPGDIYHYDFDEQKTVKLTDSDYNDGFGSYSGDMSNLVFRSGRNGSMDLYLKNELGIQRLTNTPAKENFPVISLRGDKIIYASDESLAPRENDVKAMDLYMLQKQGNGWSRPVQITSEITLEAHPHFSPDGEWIVYTSEEFGIMDEQPILQHYIFSPQMYGEIVARRIDDGKKVRITHNKWEDGAPIWERPVSREFDIDVAQISDSVATRVKKVRN